MKEIKMTARPWQPQDLLDDLQLMIDEQPDNYLNTDRTTLCTAKAYLEEHFAEPKWISVKDRLPESQNPVLVVAVSKGMGLPYIFKAAHINHHEITEDEYGWTDGEYDSEYDEENDCFWIPECWYECNAVEGNTNWIMDDDYTITHWMPLPQPPKGE